MNVSRIANILVIIIATAVILIYTKAILIPFFLAVIIWFLIREVQRLTRMITIGGRTLPVWIRGLVSFLLIFGVLGAVVSLLAKNIQDISETLPLYEENLIHFKNNIEAATGFDLMGKAREIGGDMNITSMLQKLLTSLTSIFGNAFLVIIYVAFLMLEETFFMRKIKAFHNDEKRFEQTRGMVREIDSSLSKYVTLKTGVSLVTGTLSYIALRMIGVDFAFFWAFLIFVLNYIPTVGSLIGTLFPALIAGIQYGELAPAVWVLAAVGAIQVLVGNLLEPKLMGDSLNVSSLVVLLSLAFWGSIWGIVGMVLSVPITVMMVLVFAQFPATRGVAALLSARGRVN